MARGYWRGWEERGGSETKKRSKTMRCHFCGAIIERKDILEHLKTHSGGKIV